MRFAGLRRYTWKWWLALPFSIGDLYRRLSPKDRAIHGMSCWWYGDLERRPVQEFFQRSPTATFTVVNAGRRDPTTSTTLFELDCVLMALHEVEARRVLEIGTFDGNTTLNLALNLGEGGQVVTCDLPLEGAASYAIEVKGAERNMTDRRVVGEQFKGHAVEGRIRQVFGDTAKLDFATLGGPFDVAFIDGCHAYEYVKSDTDNVLRVMRPGGLVLWHDYAEMEPVSRAVDEYRDRFDALCALQGTRLAVGRVRGGPAKPRA